jgi:uncharacterized membrane protein
MTNLVLAIVAFVGGHFLLSSSPVRKPAAARVGEQAFIGLYSGLMLAAFVWMIKAFLAAPFVPLWSPPDGARLIPAIVMPFASLLFVGSLTVRNPTMVMQSVPASGDPAPGVLKVTRFQMLWAFGLWAVAHLIVSGDAAGLLLFGAIAILALVGTLTIDAKRRARSCRLRAAGGANVQSAAGGLDRGPNPAQRQRRRLVADHARSSSLCGGHAGAPGPHADVNRLLVARLSAKLGGANCKRSWR